MGGHVVDEQRGHGRVEVALDVLLDAADPSDVEIAAAAEPSLDTPDTDSADTDSADDDPAEGAARSGRRTPARNAGRATPSASTDGVRAYLAEITYNDEAAAEPAIKAAGERLLPPLVKEIGDKLPG